MSLFVDLLSTVSVVGIWPRYIEPRLLHTTKLIWDLPTHAHHLDGLKILHISDLHFHKGVPQSFLDKILRRAARVKPDLVLFTGDFLCYSQLDDRERLKSFLQNLHAPQGAYCCFGNHDYSHYVSLNSQGKYDIVPPPNPLLAIGKGIATLLSSPTRHYEIADRAKGLSPHEALVDLLKETPFVHLNNETRTLPIGLNLSGLGDLGLGQFRPQEAFKNYEEGLPGITLSHNPDTFPELIKAPGDWILSGHTHGEQIHFPWARHISRKLARLKHSDYTRGLFTVEGKKLYVNRGLGCHKPFRFCSPPELCVIYARKTWPR